MLTSTSSLIQTKALIRRYLIALYRSPIRSLTRILLWPSLLLGLCFYFLFNSQDEEYMEVFVPVITQFVTAVPVYHFVEWLVTDKAIGMNSLMISMGLKRTPYYLANSLCFMAFVLPIMLAVAAISMIFIFKDISSESSLIAIFLVFILFVAHLTGFVFALASIITSTSCLAIVFVLMALETRFHSFILWLIERSCNSMQPLILFAASVSPYESLRIMSSGYTLCKNCNTTKVSEDFEFVNQPLYLILIAMSVWTLVVTVFARCFDQALASWKGNKIKRTSNSLFFSLKPTLNHLDSIEMEDEIESTRDSKYFEQTMSNREVSIHVNRVTKEFRDVPVIDDLTFNIYKGETTLLLGHNGAGKTTLMNIILNKLRPDKGKVIFMPSDQSQSRMTADGHGVGVCPQNNVLDDNLNVRQHLELFVDIKCSEKMSATERESHINTTLEDVSLSGHVGKVPSELSGGMRRKLSLAMAFVGKSSTLILDEPSSGLDPDSRVSIWNAIRRYRADRTVLLSTQHMEEADYLGDRIAIMSLGRIVCCGSSTFLNKILGTGYKLRLECHLSKKKEILQFIRRFFPETKFVSPSDNVPTLDGFNQQAWSQEESVQDVVVELAGGGVDDYENRLILMLTEMEKRSVSEELHIISHGLKSSSIEDVMLNTSKSSATNETQASVELNITSTIDHVKNLANMLKKAPHSNWFTIQSLFLKALIIKHIQTYKSDWKTIIFFRLVVAIYGAWSLVDRLNSVALYPAFFANLFNTFMILHFVHYPTSERVSKFKTMQLTSSLNFLIYWLSQLMIDSISIIVLVVGINVIFGFTFKGVLIASELSIRLIVSSSIALLGISGAILAYLLSSILNDPKLSVGYYILLNGTSIFTFCIVAILKMIFKSDLDLLNTIQNRLFICLLPTDATQYVFYGLCSKCYVRSHLTETCDEQEGEFSPVAFGIMALCGQILVYGLALYLIERQNVDLSWYCKSRHIFRAKSNFPPGEQQQQGVCDIDVMGETKKAAQLVDNVPRDAYSLVAADLDKSYVKGVKVIDNLAFSVKRGECFGLLGVNGAGKSTTFSMIIGESNPDCGRIWVDGHYTNKNVNRYRAQIGYDPQSNPEMSLTPVEALYLMARLRNVAEQSIPMLVDSVLELLKMTKHASMSAKNLSCGTKRKLALGMSLIGNPPMLALDEPTAGVDPMARRSVWELLRALRSNNGTSIIISSHAMEECEAICDRIAIMARGRLRCIGTFLQLRAKYFQGCTIKVQFASDAHRSFGLESCESISSIVSELNNNFESEIGSSVIQMVDANANSATFNVSDDKVSRAALFLILGKFKQNYPNMSYVINDSSLEDIFISLAREQQLQKMKIDADKN